MSSKVGRAGGVFEDDALVVALAITFRFGAINAYWSLFATLDPTLSACLFAVSYSSSRPKVLLGRQTQASCLGPLSGNFLRWSRRIRRY
jgi:hypothetical protein